MVATSLLVIGVVVLLAIVCCWRPWLQFRRYGSSGILFFRSGDRRQNLRDALGAVVVVCLLRQGIAAARWSGALSPVRMVYHPEVRIWQANGAVFLFGGLLLLIVAQLHLAAS